MNVVAHDPFVSDGDVSVTVGGQTLTIDCPRLPLTELLSTSDMVSVHVPAQADGSAVIGEAELASHEARFVLGERGAWRFGGRGRLDGGPELRSPGRCRPRRVCGRTFPRADVLAHDKLALTPHIGAATSEAQDRIGLELAAQIAALA